MFFRDCFIVVLMSFAALLRGADADAPRQRRPARTYRNEGATLDSEITKGESIVAYLEEQHGSDFKRRHLEYIVKKHKQNEPKEG